MIPDSQTKQMITEWGEMLASNLSEIRRLLNLLDHSLSLSMSDMLWLQTKYLLATAWATDTYCDACEAHAVRDQLTGEIIQSLRHNPDCILVRAKELLWESGLEAE